MGRGGGGGGRSSGGGFGGGRSSGGRVGGGFSSGRGNFGGFSSGRGGFSSGGFHSSPPPRPHNTTIFFGRPSYGRFWGTPPAGGPGGAPYRGRNNGCGTTAVLLVIIVVLFVAVFGGIFADAPSGSSASSITKSTIKREPLPAGSVNETEYYTDELGWISNKTTLVNGLKSFYRQTGVQPYLYLTDTVEGTHCPTVEQLDAFANELYDQLFTDEAHLLLVFFEWEGNPGSYMYRYVCGTQAKTVVDDEAADILMDYLDRYYYDTSLDESTYFAKAFQDAGERMMEITHSPWLWVAVIFGVCLLIALILLVFWQRRQAAAQKAKETETILNTPLEQFGDTEAEELAKKYEGSDESSS